MATLHFATIPCKPDTAIRHIKGHIFFGEIRTCTNNVVNARFEAYRAFLYVFMSVFKVFVC